MSSERASDEVEELTAELAQVTPVDPQPSKEIPF
jgi:hypothetical protein